jgi:hypothetical protein
VARPCRVIEGGHPRPATWQRDGDTIVVTAEGGVPAGHRLAEVSGVSGDGYAISFVEPGGSLELDRLGADGPALLESLRRAWPPLRARALRLGDADAPRLLAGSVAAGPAGTAALPCRGYFEGDLFLHAPDGGDVRPLLVPHQAAVTFDEGAYALAVTAWDGTRTTFTRFAGATAELRAGFDAIRERLGREAAETLARFLPTLPGGARAALAAEWLPGRLLPLPRLEALAAGFTAAFSSSWLAASLRSAEGAHLLGGGGEGRHLGYRPPDAGAPDGPTLLWLLARREAGWFLEVLSHEDYATYRFRDDPALPALVDDLLCLPQFSREALYLPLEQLVGDRADYAIAARDLPLLRALRPLFAGRVIHSSLEAWKREVGA